MSKEKVKKLISERDEIDSQLADLQALLKDHGVDMNTPLVDQEGFPVAELDIISIRKARHSIICLANDRKKLTDNIEAIMIDLHENARTSADKNTPESESMQQDLPSPIHRTSNKPFLRIENVVSGSPASKGGLLAEDVIIQCGPVYADNFQGLQKFSEVISQHKELIVTVLRNATVHKFHVYPGKWEGAGVFGARFTVIKDEEV